MVTWEKNLILADEIDEDLILMDDNAAQKTAKYMGHNVTGTQNI